MRASVLDCGLRGQFGWMCAIWRGSNFAIVHYFYMFTANEHGANQMLKIAVLIVAALAVKMSVFTDRSTGNRPALDTLHHPVFGTSLINHACSAFVAGYRSGFGILISNYYSVLDSLPVHLNGDKYVDTVLILSPKSLDPIENQCDFLFDRHAKRLLVEVISNPTGKAKIRGVYPDIISDVGGVLSHFSGILATKDGFKIVHEAGAQYSWSYSVEFSVINDRLGVREIAKTCSYGDRTDSLTYSYDNINLENVNVPDTLAVQCNCDALWSKWSK